MNVLKRPSVYSLVVEDDVRHPDQLGGHPDGRHVVVVGRVPAQLVVVPFLGEPRRDQSLLASFTDHFRMEKYSPTLSLFYAPMCIIEYIIQKFVIMLKIFFRHKSKFNF